MRLTDLLRLADLLRRSGDFSAPGMFSTRHRSPSHAPVHRSHYRPHRTTGFRTVRHFHAPKTGLCRLPGFRQSGCKGPVRDDHSVYHLILNHLPRNSICNTSPILAMSSLRSNIVGRDEPTHKGVHPNDHPRCCLNADWVYRQNTHPLVIGYLACGHRSHPHAPGHGWTRDRRTKALLLRIPSCRLDDCWVRIR
jgi:hypothetical protein